MREIRLGAQVQQRKPNLSCIHVFTHLRFAQRHENWTIDDWKHMIVSDETKINMFNLDGDLGMHDGFWPGSMVQN